MNTWQDRLRIALILSPAFLLFQVFMLVLSSGELIAKYGLTIPVLLIAVASIAEAYTVVLAAVTAFKFWKKTQ